MFYRYSLLLIFLVFTFLTTQAQLAGNALNFDGTDDRVNLALPALFNNLGANDFTIEAWVNPSNLVFSRILFAQLDASNFATVSLAGGGVIYCYVVVGGTTYSVNTSSGIPVNQWTHIAATWDASTTTSQIYFNGILQTTSSGGTSSNGGTNTMVIGCRPDGSQFFPGSIDELRIWNDIRTECEISQNFQNFIPGALAGLVGNYNFNQGIAGGTNTTATTLFDQSAANNDGTLVNFALTGATSNFVTSAAVINTTGTASLVITSTNTSCGLNNGAITINSAPGAAPLQYSIDNGVTFQVSNTFTGLAAATYNMVVEDVNGCQTSATETISSSTPVTIDNVVNTQVTCGLSNGALTIIASGGTSPFQYSIDNGVSFQASNSFTGLTAQTYSVVVEDANGCQETTSAVVSGLSGPNITNVSFGNDTCVFGNGWINITAAGNHGPLQYSINNGTSYQSSNMFSNLSANTYLISVRDTNGCTASSSAVIVSLPGATINNTVNTQATCGAANGTITIEATGGTGSLMYSIDAGVTFQASNIFTGLAANTYSIVVEDGNGCIATAGTNVTAAAVATITNFSTTPETCGNADGGIIITATGAAQLIYSVDNGVTFQPNGTFPGLSAGTYDLLVEDDNGCQVTATATVNSLSGATIDNVATTPATCLSNDGTIIISATGTLPMQYSIDNGVNFQAGSNFTGLASGTYDVVVEDDNGCQTTSTATVATLATVITGTATTTDATCGATDGSITVTATNGTTPHEYSLDGNTFVASNVFSGLAAGSYTVTIKDANGCTGDVNATVANAGGATIDSVQTTPENCGDGTGTITIFASGGASPLEYSDGNGGFQSSSNFTDLATGTYSIEVRDDNGCITSSSATVLSTSDVDVTVSQVNDSTLIANASGSSYQWLDCDNNYAPLIGGNNISFLASVSGNYAVAVTQNNCTDTSACNSIVIIGIDDLAFARNIKLYPNPTNGMVNIDLGAVQSAITVKVINTLGQVVAVQQYNQVDKASFNIEAQSGIYMITVQNETGQTATFRVVKD